MNIRWIQYKRRITSEMVKAYSREHTISMNQAKQELENVIATFYTEERAKAFQHDVKQNGHYISYVYDGKNIQYTMTYDHIKVIDISDKLGLE